MIDLIHGGGGPEIGEDATLRRERNLCEHPSASLIEPPSSAMDEFIIFKHVKPV